MPNSKPNPNPELSDGLYRLDHPDSDIFLPRPIRSSSVATLGDYIQQLREVSNESNECEKPCIACQPSESNKSSHACIANPNINCNCVNVSRCSELGNDPDNITDLADKINCIGNPYPKRNTERNTENRNQDHTPCVVVGAIFKTSI